MWRGRAGWLEDGLGAAGRDLLAARGRWAVAGCRSGGAFAWDGLQRSDGPAVSPQRVQGQRPPLKGFCRGHCLSIRTFRKAVHPVGTTIRPVESNENRKPSRSFSRLKGTFMTNESGFSSAEAPFGSRGRLAPRVSYILNLSYRVVMAIFGVCPKPTPDL